MEDGLRRMSHGPQHFENNNCQGKGCHSVCVKMQCDKKSLLAAVNSSKKHNLMSVGGYPDNVVDLCGEDNADESFSC